MKKVLFILLISITSCNSFTKEDIAPEVQKDVSLPKLTLTPIDSSRVNNGIIPRQSN